MKRNFSYRHLYYFWVVAKEGGISRAAIRLGMAVQTVSAQVRELERALGYALLKPAGRGLALTEAGRAAMQQAEHIFELGEQLPGVVREAATTMQVRLALGISDGLAKFAVRDLLDPVLQEPNLHLLCHEGEFDDLLADLALHRLDLVLADRPAHANPNLKLNSHLLVSTTLDWYAPPQWQAKARRGFPASLAEVPVLLPTAHSATRLEIDLWFERQGIRPRIFGEFEDSALLTTFASAGMGVFPAAGLEHAQLSSRYGVRRIGRCEGVHERFYAISAGRKVAHPAVQTLLRRAGSA